MSDRSGRSPQASIERLPAVDGLRCAGALLIVLHHLALYGPMARALATDFPWISDELASYGRFAVYVFLVVAGFMAALSLEDRVAKAELPAAGLILRYLRLAMPLGAALLLAVLCAEVARHWSAEAYLPPAPSAVQVMAHLGLLQGVLGLESLTAGVWYIAVEIQLFVLFVALLKLDVGLPVNGPPVGRIFLLVLASWSWWHGRAGLDDWAPYFFGAYGLGVLAAWTSRAALQGQRLLWWAMLLAITVLLAADWRGRMAVALGAALVLRQWGFQRDLPFLCPSPVHWLGQRSYALFLIHFPVLMLANTLFGVVPAHAAAPVLPFLAVTLAICILAAAVFHSRIEQPCQNLLARHLPAGRDVCRGLWSPGLQFIRWCRSPNTPVASQAVTNHD